MYKKPMDYLSDMCQLISISEDKLKSHWPIFVEAKARRDLGMHADWRCNDIYLGKLRKANIKPKLHLGDSAVPDTSEYLPWILNSLNDIAKIIKEEVILKYLPHDRSTPE